MSVCALCVFFPSLVSPVCVSCPKRSDARGRPGAPQAAESALGSVVTQEEVQVTSVNPSNSSTFGQLSRGDTK